MRMNLGYLDFDRLVGCAISKLVAGGSVSGRRRLLLMLTMASILTGLTSTFAQPVGLAAERAVIRNNGSVEVRSEVIDRRLDWVGSGPANRAEAAVVKALFDRPRGRPGAAAGQGSSSDVNSEDAESVESFLASNPTSGFAAPLRNGLADFYSRNGRVSRGRAHWKEVINQLASNQTDAGRRAATEATIRYAEAVAAEGDLVEAEAIAPDLRAARPDSDELWAIRRRALERVHHLQNSPTMAYRGGIQGLLRLARRAGWQPQDSRRLSTTPVPIGGFSPSELVQIGQSHGLPIGAAQRPANADWVAPSLVHLKNGHYLFLESIASSDTESGSLYKVTDLSRSKTWRMTAASLSEEASGLVVGDSTILPNSWVRANGGNRRGLVRRNGSGPSDPFTCIPEDAADIPPPCDDCEECPPGRGGPSSMAAGGATSEDENCGPDGMVRWRVSEPFLNLWLEDFPLSYQPSRGAEVSFRLRYHHRGHAVANGDNGHFSSVGPYWDCDWLSWIDARSDVSGSQQPVPGGHIKIYYPGGGMLVVNFPLNSHEAYDYNSNTRVTRLLFQDFGVHNGDVVGYEVLFSSGRKLIYRHSQVPGVGMEFYLSQFVDPVGNKTQLLYNTSSSDQEVRLSNIIDADGRLTTVGYEPNSLRINQVTDPYGRTALLEYNTDDRLYRITDAAGMVSEMVYLPDGRVQTVTTPYGITEFVDEDTGSAAVPFVELDRVVIIREKDLLGNLVSQQAYGYDGDSSQLPDFSPFLAKIEPEPHPTIDPSVVADPLFKTVDTWWVNSFYWDRRAMGILAARHSDPFVHPDAITDNTTQSVLQDYALARRRNWLESHSRETLNFERSPSHQLPDVNGDFLPGPITWFDYPGKEVNWEPGSSPMPLLVATVLENNENRFVYTARNPLGRTTQEKSSYTKPDGTLGVRSRQFNFASNHFNLLSFTDFNGDLIQEYAYNASQLIATNWIHVGGGASYTNLFQWSGTQLASLDLGSGLSREVEYYHLPGNDPNDGFVKRVIDKEQGVLLATNAFTWNQGLIASRTNVLGGVRNYQWDGLNRLVSTSRPGEAPRNLSYQDASGTKLLGVTALTNALGGTIGAAYNSLGQLTEITNELGQVTHLEYCDCGSVESVSRAFNTADELVTRYEYDLQGKATNIVYSPNQSVRREYNRLGQVTNIIDAQSSLRLFYNNQGLVTRVDDASGPVYKVEYDINDRPHIVTDASGVSVTNSYDLQGRLTKVEDETGAVTLTHSARGLIGLTNQLQQVWSYQYDVYGRRTQMTSPEQRTQSYQYDPAGNLTRLTDENNHQTSWEYDSEGRQLRKFDHHGAKLLELAYDALDRTTNRWTRANGVARTITYDAGSNLKSVTYPAGLEANNVTYDYDSLNRLTNVVDTVIGSVGFQFDADGRLKRETGPLPGASVTYDYFNDGLRKELKIQPGTGTPWIQTYAYDANSRLDSITTPSGVFDYRYDSLGGPLAPSTPIWDQLVLPNQSRIERDLDALGRVSETRLETSSGAVLNSHGYTFRANSQRERHTLLSGNYWDYGYDDGRLISAEGFEPGGTERRWHEQLGYQWDAAGNLLTRTNNLQFTSLTVNSLNQLDTGSSAGPAPLGGLAGGPSQSVKINDEDAELYGDDAYAHPGQSLSVGQNTITTEGLSSTGETARHVSMVNYPGTINYTHDDNGNQQGDGHRNYVYDVEDRLVEVTEPGKVKVNFAYDGLSRMRRKTTYFWSTSVSDWQLEDREHYVYDGLQVVQILDDSGSPKETLTRGLDLASSLGGAGGIGGLLAYTDHEGASDRTAYYHADSIGNVTAMVDSSEAVLARYQYDPFGRTLGMSGPLAAENPFRFSSQMVEPNTGLYGFAYRFYDPPLQRWLNRDPIGESGGVNLYQAFGGDPVNQIDPFGLEERGYQKLGDDDLDLDGDVSYGGLTGVSDPFDSFRCSLAGLLRGLASLNPLVEGAEIVSTGKSVTGDDAGAADIIAIGVGAAKVGKVCVKAAKGAKGSKAAVEAASKARAQKLLGRNLEDSVDPAFDYVDDLGRTYDQMGNPAMVPHWANQKQQFFNQINRHLQKADFTVIDLSNFPKHIQDDVSRYLLTLPENLFDKIVPIGF